MTHMTSFVRRRVFAPITALLLQGISPKHIAMSLAVGLIVGVFPVLGVTTVLCTIAAISLRLNLVAVHAVHFAATPLQVLLIIPFVRIGEHVVGASAQPLSLSEGFALIERGIGHAVMVLWDAIVHAVIGWLVLGPFAIALVYFAGAWLLERMNAATLKRKSAQSQTALANQPPL
jgi:uncharacterized protein (DUF2062 family)